MDPVHQRRHYGGRGTAAGVVGTSVPGHVVPGVLGVPEVPGAMVPDVPWCQVPCHQMLWCQMLVCQVCHGARLHGVLSSRWLAPEHEVCREHVDVF